MVRGGARERKEFIKKFVRILNFIGNKRTDIHSQTDKGKVYIYIKFENCINPL